MEGNVFEEMETKYQEVLKCNAKQAKVIGELRLAIITLATKALESVTPPVCIDSELFQEVQLTLEKLQSTEKERTDGG